PTSGRPRGRAPAKSPRPLAARAGGSDRRLSGSIRKRPSRPRSSLGLRSQPIAGNARGRPPNKERVSHHGARYPRNTSPQRDRLPPLRKNSSQDRRCAIVLLAPLQAPRSPRKTRYSENFGVQVSPYRPRDAWSKKT